MIKISIVTAVYNAEATIRDTLESVASQSYPDVEHIVVDGNSSDDTIKIVNEGWDRVSKIVSEKDRGVYDAMNKGISLCTGDVIGFLNADDFYANRDVLKEVAEAFADPRIDACYADLLYIDPIHLNQPRRYWKSRPYEAGLFERGWMPAHPTFYVRRSVYQQLGGFDLQFPRQADVDLTMRFLAVANVPSVYVPHTWVHMRVGGISNNSLIGIVKGNLEAHRAAVKNGLDIPIWYVLLKILSRVPQFLIRFRRNPI